MDLLGPPKTLLSGSSMKIFVATQYVPEVSIGSGNICGLPLTQSLGVAATGITRSVDTNCMDREATAAMSLIHQVQSSDHEKGMGIQPEDIANALLFLISSRSRSTNGAIIPIDNAWSTI